MLLRSSMTCARNRFPSTSNRVLTCRVPSRGILSLGITAQGIRRTTNCKTAKRDCMDRLFKCARQETRQIRHLSLVVKRQCRGITCDYNLFFTKRRIKNACREKRLWKHPVRFSNGIFQWDLRIWDPERRVEQAKMRQWLWRGYLIVLKAFRGGETLVERPRISRRILCSSSVSFSCRIHPSVIG